MKKLIAFFLAGMMVLSAVGCGNSPNTQSIQSESETKASAADSANATETAATSAKGEGTDGRPTVGSGKIGVSTITLGQEFFSDLDTKIHNRLEAEGYEVITVSCEANSATQISDLENLITMGCEAIFFFAIDPDALVDVCKKGREAGIKMYGMACTMDDRDAYDKIINTDQYSAGLGAAELAAAWIDKTFPDAEDGSIEVAVIGMTGTVDGNNRTEGEKKITELTKKAKLAEYYELTGAPDANIKSQEYAEMMQSQIPDLKCIISYSCDASLGTNEVFMRDTNLNSDEFAIFGVDTSGVIYKEIQDSTTNDSLIRGTISLGDDLSLDVWECLIDADLEYMDDKGYVCKPVTKITTENIGDYIK